MAPTKGKQGTKGAKQIKEENKNTFNYYSYIIIATVVTVLLYQFGYNYNSYRFIHIFWLLFSFVIYALSMKTMSSMTNSGLDLNMEAGMAEHVKDVIILTAACQVLSCISLYFWFFWLIIPFVAFYKLWVNVLAPWFFAAPPEVSEKKKKKMERKQKYIAR